MRLPSGLAILAALSCGGDPNVRQKPFILTDRASLGWGAEFASAVYVGTSVPQSLSVENRSGYEDLVIDDVTKAGDSEFAFRLPGQLTGQQPSDVLPHTVKPLKKTYIELTFSPTAVGRYSGSLTIKSNAENVTDLKIDLYGSAIKKGVDGGANQTPDGGCP